MSNDDALPAPDDLKAWKQAGQRATELPLHMDLFKNRFVSAKAFTRFFDHDDFDGVARGPEAVSIMPTYDSWLVYEYRPTASSNTIAEVLLKDNLPAAVAMLLAARAKAHPSVYRLTSVDPDTGFIDLEDIIAGGRLRIHDKALSGCAQVDVCVPMYVFAAGAFHIADMAGPPISLMQVCEAIEFLRDNGMELTPQGQKLDSHLFGWLWDWRDEQADRPMPKVVNMDGDEMVLQTASFSVGDHEKTRQHLLSRKDVEPDGDTFRWFITKGPAAERMGGNVSLGTIELIADELILSTNSPQRLEQARKWLEAIPGVHFQRTEARSIEQAMAARPMDETIAPPAQMQITPELQAEFQQRMSRYYMDWLDKPLPAFKGKTPRQMSRTPEGRVRVAIMIRTIPSPCGQAPIEVPRDAMLRELGILV